LNPRERKECSNLADRHLPSALDGLPEIRATVGERKVAFFLDFDGTLAPLVGLPDLAEMPAPTREVLHSLAQRHLVCFISGRGLADLRRKIGLVDVYYAGDHGYHILGPVGSGIELEVGPGDRSELESAAHELEERLRPIVGAVVEAKETSLSVHYRLVAKQERPLVNQIVDEVVKSSPGLALAAGMSIHELRPQIPWGKGRAVAWLLEQLGLQRSGVCPVCLGDDITDEDMFFEARTGGIAILVGEPCRTTQAHYTLKDHNETAAFLKAFDSDEPSRAPLV
jgi:trehalose 6-phosphate phosphatase